MKNVVATAWLVLSACSAMKQVGTEDGGTADAGLMCPSGPSGAGARPVIPWTAVAGDAGVPDGGSSCVFGDYGNLSCSGRARIEPADAGPVLVFDDGSQLGWTPELAAGLKAPHVTGASADVSLTVSSYRPVPFGAFVQTITMRVFEPATGKVLWFSRGGYGVREALSDAESTELFGAAPSYRDFCTMRYDRSVCWPVTRTYSEVDIASVALEPNELKVVRGYEVRWVQSGEQATRPANCVGDDGADPTPDCTFGASYQGP